ncbi:hypothetical protein Tco_0222699 [Tanacetum coccineum]
MTTLADKVILSGADNRPPMLEKDMYDSWKSIMELYMMNRQHGRMILKSVENGPLIWPTIEENGNNRTAHFDYLRHTQEQAAILRKVVEQGKSQNALNNSLDSTCKYTKRIQELLIIIRQMCPSINNSSDKLVVVTLKNKDKRVRFTEPVTSLGNTNIKTTSLLGLKAFLMLFGITTVLIDVNVAQSKLVQLENFNENYSKCLRLL